MYFNIENIKKYFVYGDSYMCLILILILVVKIYVDMELLCVL